MTDQEMRIAIAEACGWKRGRHFEQLLSTGEGETWDGWIDPHTDEWQLEAPDYCSDLNAINDAVLSLCRASAVEWANQLYMLCRENHPDKDVAMATATARQRAEAFLRALNLWKD